MVDGSINSVSRKKVERKLRLLHRALSDTGKIGVAKVAISSREYLAAVKPDGLFLILELMHFAHEVLEPESLTSAGDREVAPAPKELEMAKKLIDAMTTEWKPTRYKEEYQTAVMEMSENKGRASRAFSEARDNARSVERRRSSGGIAAEPAKCGHSQETTRTGKQTEIDCGPRKAETAHGGLD